MVFILIDRLVLCFCIILSLRRTGGFSGITLCYLGRRSQQQQGWFAPCLSTEDTRNLLIYSQGESCQCFGLFKASIDIGASMLTLFSEQNDSIGCYSNKPQQTFPDPLVCSIAISLHRNSKKGVTSLSSRDGWRFLVCIDMSHCLVSPRFQVLMMFQQLRVGRCRQVPLMFELIRDFAFSRASFSKYYLYGTNQFGVN